MFDFLKAIFDTNSKPSQPFFLMELNVFTKQTANYDSGAKFTSPEFCLPCVRGGTPFYKPYRYMQPQRVAVLWRFGVKTGIDFAYFGLESGIVFEGTTRSHHYHFSPK